MFRCVVCNRINESYIACAYCGCTVLFEDENIKEKIRCDVYEPAVPADFDIRGVEQKECEQKSDWYNRDFNQCPVCGICIQIDEVNCKIFRCGRLLSGYINPHASKDEIANLMASADWLGGCGTPLQYVEEQNRLEVIYDGQGNLWYK